METSSVRARRASSAPAAPSRGASLSPALLWVGVAAAAAAGLVWWATAPWGPGLSPDAIAYSAIAERIRDHGQVGYWLEPQATSWPPLFPAVLALGSKLTGASVVDVGRAVNALVQAGLVVVTAALAWRLLRSNWLRGVAVMVAAVAQPLVYVATKVWSEPLFLLLVLSAGLVLSGVPGPRPTARVVGASALICGVFATRYAGFAFVPAAVGVLALWPRATSRRDRFVRVGWFAAPAAVVAGGMLAWNRARSGNALGPRWRPHQPFWEHAADGLAAVGSWFLPTGAARSLTILGGLLLFALVAFALARTWRPDPMSTRVIGVVPVLAAFVLCYFGYMVWARTTSGFDPLSSRLMLPILLPAVLLLLWFAERWASRVPLSARRVVLALPLIVLLPMGARGVEALRDSHDIGNEYTNAAVRDVVGSPILQALPTGCSLVSNDPWLVWLAGSEAQLTPESDREVAIPQSMTLDDFAAQVQAQDVCLVWFATGSQVFFTPDQLAEVVQLQTIDADDFTTVYRVTAPA